MRAVIGVMQTNNYFVATGGPQETFLKQLLALKLEICIFGAKDMVRVHLLIYSGFFFSILTFK